MDIGGMSVSAIQGYTLEPLGDCGLLVKLGNEMNEAILALVTAVTGRLEEAAASWDGYVECVPAYASVALYYNPYQIITGMRSGEERQLTAYATICNRVHAALTELRFVDAAIESERNVRIPVCYGGELGPDLVEVAEHAGLATDEVIALHSGAAYTVYMIGFAPGFPYLGGMPESIAAPRRSSPRLLIPPGSVGIAGMQTGVYPVGTPGGWQIIGRTPLALFRPGHRRPSLLQGGDRIQFVPITREQYDDWPKGTEDDGWDGEWDNGAFES